MSFWIWYKYNWLRMKFRFIGMVIGILGISYFFTITMDYISYFPGLMISLLWTLTFIASIFNRYFQEIETESIPDQPITKLSRRNKQKN